MAEETQINLRFKFTVGSVLLWLSFLLPIVLINVAHSVDQMQAAFCVPGVLLVLGFFVSCWQDYKAKAPFSVGRLIYVITMLIILVIVMPVFMSAAVAAGNVERLSG